MNEQMPGLGSTQAPRAQIEKRLIVELSDGGAVRALDGRRNLELRLCVDLRVFREQERPVGLLGVVFCASGRTMILPLKTPRA